MPEAKRARSADPVFEHFEEKGDHGTSGKDMKCKFCNEVFPKLKAKRARCHLAGVSGQGIKVCLAVSAEVKHQIKTNLGDIVPQSRTAQSLDKCWHGTDAQAVDMAVAEFFYDNGIGFSVASTPSYKKMISAVSQQKRAYK